MTNRLSKFVDEERGKYSGYDNNHFAFSSGQAVQYYEYLLLILSRYEEAFRNFASNFEQLRSEIWAKGSGTGSGKMSPKQQKLFKESFFLSTKVHLEIESFYLFAKIFLDKLALFLQDYFGQVRSASLASHNKLLKNHKRFSSEKKITLPDGFTYMLGHLQGHISEYRDKQITHLKTPPYFFLGTFFEKNGKTIFMKKNSFFPEMGKEAKSEALREEVKSESIPGLLNTIDRYVEKVIETIRLNRKKSRFVLEK